jgi:hypothetical protein
MVQQRAASTKAYWGMRAYFLVEKKKKPPRLLVKQSRKYVVIQQDIAEYFGSSIPLFHLYHRLQGEML